MSYDLRFYRLTGSGAAIDEVRQLNESEEEPASCDEDDRRREALAKELVSLDPRLKIILVDGACWIASEAPDCPVPDIHLEGRTGGTSWSYSADSKAIFPVIQRVMAVVEKYGYVIFDPQLDELDVPKESARQAAAFK